ncbi:hypothetical protein [Corynebacterium mastitidis]|uniref:hypothetical protein n=1 Tax=Corynebacterium mastitidis TaxID=161890 RepID=UPI00254CF06C|nr:hypothetical protein [Corynebacterium mastitidis]MDK8451520.1 hypothetical protein [Corynebacterium mastitidis]
MKGLKLWRGLMESGNLIQLASRVLLLGFIMLPGSNANWFSFAVAWAWIAASSGSSWRLDAAYASLNVPRQRWLVHRRIDAAIETLVSVVIVVAALPWGDLRQIALLVTAAVMFGRALLSGRKAPRGGYVGQSLESRVQGYESDGPTSDAEDKKKEGLNWKPWRWVRYPETSVGQNIMEPQVTVWLGWGVGVAVLAVLAALYSWIFHTASIAGFIFVLIIVSVGMGALTEGEIQRSYAQWIRFGGGRSEWARWTALVGIIPVLFAILIGAFVGFTNGSGIMQGMLVGLACGILMMPGVVLAAVTGKDNVGWVVILVLVMLLWGCLGLANNVTVAWWFTIQGLLAVGVLALLPWLIRDSAQELWGLGVFFGIKEENAEQT